MPDDYDSLLDFDLNEGDSAPDHERPSKDQADGATMLLYDLVYRRGLTRADLTARGAIEPHSAGGH